ncbi:MAG: DUF4352 domain-containing protein [Bacilli bacterium]|nr:DUF4352 domain-containing protein [Bacilli bacterium]
MIIRKPYAFLIKNFRKIHIALLIVGLFLIYRTIDISRFVNTYMREGIYDLYANPVSKHISSLVMFCAFFMIVGSASLLFLLLHKKKPWKTYLIPTITYVALFLILSMIRSFFADYKETIDPTDLRFARDLLLMVMLGQLPALGVYVMRIFGLDIKKFDFNSDLEMLDLSEEDREEIEISIDFDFNTVKRIWKKLIRNIGYFYNEHKIISKTIIGVLIVMFLYNSYVFIFVTNRTYKQGQTYKANGYVFKVTNSYYTDKDVKGEVISKDSNFVIVEVSVKNSSAPRNLNINNFHLHAGSRVYETTETTYAKEFEDLGKCYSKVKEMKRDEEGTFILIYKVNKKIRKGKFVLYFQEKGGIFKLRKIKLKIKDIRKVEKTKKLKLGEYFDVPLYGKEDSISIEEVHYSKSIDYKINKCTSEGCELQDHTYIAPKNYKVMEIVFSSESYEAKNMIDFLSKYGRINYKDSNGKEKSLDIKFAVTRSYFGKTIYLKVPEDFDQNKNIRLEITVRNKDYSYKLS